MTDLGWPIDLTQQAAGNQPGAWMIQRIKAHVVFLPKIGTYAVQVSTKQRHRHREIEAATGC